MNDQQVTEVNILFTVYFMLLILHFTSFNLVFCFIHILTTCIVYKLLFYEQVLYSREVLLV